FAVVGLIVWVPLRLLTHHRHSIGPELQSVGRTAGLALHKLGATARQTVAFGGRGVRRLASTGFAVASGLFRLTFGTARVVIELAVITLCGMVVGVLFGGLHGLGD